MQRFTNAFWNHKRLWYSFLDIQLNHENGIDIGLKLKHIYHDCRIIIISNYMKYALEGYKIHADRYFLKPITQELFNIEMENIIKNHFKNILVFMTLKYQIKKYFIMRFYTLNYIAGKQLLIFRAERSIVLITHLNTGMKNYMNTVFHTLINLLLSI